MWLGSQHLSQTSCGQLLAAGIVAVWAVQVLNSLWKCLSTRGPTLGAKLLSQVYLSLLARRGSSTGPTGIQDTETLGILDGIDII